jgi:hypothetical protein
MGTDSDTNGWMDFVKMKGSSSSKKAPESPRLVVDDLLGVPKISLFAKEPCFLVRRVESVRS